MMARLRTADQFSALTTAPLTTAAVQHN